MTKALITCGKNPGIYFLEKWLPQYSFIYGDASFINQISADQQLLLPAVSQADFIHQLLNICLDQQIEAVFAMSSAEQNLLAEATELFSEFNIQLHLPDLISLKLLQNPTEILQKLKNQGIKTVSFQVTSSFAEFSKACLQLGYPTESIAVAVVQNPDLVWIVNDQLKTNLFDRKPVVPFTKAAKLFAADEQVLLKQFHPAKHKTVYASFIDGKSEVIWNADENIAEELILQTGTSLHLNGLFEFNLQDNQLFNIKTFAII